MRTGERVKILESEELGIYDHKAHRSINDNGRYARTWARKNRALHLLTQWQRNQYHSVGISTETMPFSTNSTYARPRMDDWKGGEYDQLSCDSTEKITDRRIVCANPDDVSGRSYRKMREIMWQPKLWTNLLRGSLSESPCAGTLVSESVTLEAQTWDLF